VPLFVFENMWHHNELDDIFPCNAAFLILACGVFFGLWQNKNPSSMRNFQQHIWDISFFDQNIQNTKMQWNFMFCFPWMFQSAETPSSEETVEVRM
jgi:hypothetical protein